MGIICIGEGQIVKVQILLVACDVRTQSGKNGSDEYLHLDVRLGMVSCRGGVLNVQDSAYLKEEF